jgi:hypothetical protein
LGCEEECRGGGGDAIGCQISLEKCGTSIVVGNELWRNLLVGVRPPHNSSILSLRMMLIVYIDIWNLHTCMNAFRSSTDYILVIMFTYRRPFDVVNWSARTYGMSDRYT